MAFPYEFGSIPGTCAADGDALDVLVLGLAPTFPGCLATVRLIGLLHAWQVEEGKRIRNDRLIGVAETPVNPAAIRELRSLNPRQLREIEHFFESYNRAQGREFRITGRAGRKAAEAALVSAMRAFADQAAL
jgi:inorganic pyrophosphatase